MILIYKIFLKKILAISILLHYKLKNQIKIWVSTNLPRKNSSNYFLSMMIAHKVIKWVWKYGNLCLLSSKVKYLNNRMRETQKNTFDQMIYLFYNFANNLLQKSFHIQRRAKSMKPINICLINWSERYVTIIWE